jgi:phosphate-selective porin OprO/OprP
MNRTDAGAARGARTALASRRVCAALALALAAGVVPAPAQEQKPAPPVVTAGWRDGFFIQSADGDFRLQIGMLVHADGRFVPGDDRDAVTDTFLVRRARPSLRGRFAQRFDFLLAPEFAGGNLVLQDAYIDTVLSPAFRIRVGKAKTPFGLERAHSASNFLFLERGLPSSLVPNRDVGIQLLGDRASGTLSYMAGVMNGAADGASADVDTSDSKDVAGRVVVRPFAARTASVLRGLGVGLGLSAGRQSGAASLPSLRTTAAQQPYFSYNGNGATADGVRTRYTPQAIYYYKAFGGFAEYVHSALPIRKGATRADIGHEAWQVAASFVLTGEAATDAGAGIRPRANFDFGGGHPGAVQVAVRYHALEIDDLAFALDLPAAGSSRRASGWTLGLNWFLTPNFKYVANYERTVFDGGADGARPPEHAVAVRAQVNF